MTENDKDMNLYELAEYLGFKVLTADYAPSKDAEARSVLILTNHDKTTVVDDIGAALLVLKSELLSRGDK